MIGVKKKKRRPKKRKWKRTLRNFVVGAVGPVLLRIWTWTLRIRYVDVKHQHNGMPWGRTHGVYVFWHQRMLVFAALYRNSDVRILISQHGDGDMIARVVERLGFRPVRGSSTRGGTRAILEILRQKTEDFTIAITPDGPRGPRHVFQEGAIYLASRTGLPIYPVVVSFKRHAKLPTWDGFILPCPFTATVVRLGKPFEVPRNADREAIEAVRAEVEKSLRDLTETTDKNLLELFRRGKKTLPPVKPEP